MTPEPPTFGSLFAGAGGFDIGFDRAGFRGSWQVEIDGAARDVLARHWPNVERHDDVRNVGTKNLTPVDVIVGGFPCQDLSVAGKRAGLQGGERSGLWWEMLRVIDELRPRVVVWENVPGLLSSDGGRDFARVVFSLGERGYFGAWRILDAQHFGVPQRRRRVFGVFFGERSGAIRAAEVLALREGVRGDSQAGRTTRQDVAGSLGGGSGTRGWCDDLDRCGAYAIRTSQTGANGANGANVSQGKAMTLTSEDQPQAILAACLTRREGKGPNSDADSGNLIVFDSKQSGEGSAGIAPTLRAMPHDKTHANAGKQLAICVTGERTHALTAEGHDAGEDGTGRGPPLVFQTRYTRNGRGAPSEIAPALTSCEGGTHADTKPHVIGAGAVRRLMPIECERLMGWPDDWTRYRANGKELADGPRYRLCGNGVVGTVSEWIARRLMEVLKRDA